jgi:hypothetical protein
MHFRITRRPKMNTLKMLIASALVLLATSSVFARDNFLKEELARLPQDKVQIIRQHCAKHWPDDFEMREYCENNQYKALTHLIERSGEQD